MLYGIDASSGQGSVVWSEVAKSCAFGFEKVTQGTGYVNPYWSTSKAQLLGLQAKGDFVPGAYMFLEQGNAAAQADFFARQAGNLDGWLIAVDGEPTIGSKPAPSDLTLSVGQLRLHYPKSLICGYLPQWYWGNQQSFTEFDWLWASHYVSGSGTPSGLYASVSADWWGGYGGRAVELLQFTESANVPGVTGNVDASAFRGTLAELKALTTKGATPPVVKPPTTTTGGKMYVFDQPSDKQVAYPVPSGTTKITLYSAPIPGGPLPAIEMIVIPGDVHTSHAPTWEHPDVYSLPKDAVCVALRRHDAGNAPVTLLFS